MVSLILAATLGRPVMAQDSFVWIPRSRFVESKVPARFQTLTAEVESKTPFIEVVPSFSANVVGFAGVKLEIQPAGLTQWYDLGTWSPMPGQRSSVKQQKDDDGQVFTDTLVLKQPVKKLKLRVTLTPGEVDQVGLLRSVSLALTPSNWKTATDRPLKSVWGKPLVVPERAQGNYPGGGVLCSPTSVSMILNYWSEQLKRPDLSKDVPEIQAGIHDPAWGGTGNWTFNMAYAANFTDMWACVTRLRGVNDLERMIAAKIPVAVSVSYALLKGEPKTRANDGHLVVVIGFDEKGDAIINDPAKRDQVRRVYPRADLIRGWAASKNTVYLVFPEGHKLPSSTGPWPGKH